LFPVLVLATFVPARAFSWSIMAIVEIVLLFLARLVHLVIWLLVLAVVTVFSLPFIALDWVYRRG
jgi:hypothetical protein